MFNQKNRGTSATSDAVWVGGLLLVRRCQPKLSLALGIWTNSNNLSHSLQKPSTATRQHVTISNAASFWFSLAKEKINLALLLLLLRFLRWDPLIGETLFPFDFHRIPWFNFAQISEISCLLLRFGIRNLTNPKSISIALCGDYYGGHGRRRRDAFWDIPECEEAAVEDPRWAWETWASWVLCAQRRLPRPLFLHQEGYYSDPVPLRWNGTPLALRSRQVSTWFVEKVLVPLPTFAFSDWGRILNFLYLLVFFFHF